ncbi:redoxin family protein [Pedobacter sp. Du54]|uniref:redoxin family protein n=1 Tax=Pedobacter anseongensis TaxID=3133439 RepID=UPI0030A42443
MKSIFIFFISLMPLGGFCQGLILKPGDQFPAIPITNMINAPTAHIDISQQKDKKFYILNFWGTWCSPCIPEMDALSKLQKANAGKVQVVALSDDPPVKLRNYLKTKPTTIWLATDTTWLLYNLFNFSSVSHSAILNANKEIVALVKTHSITQGLLDSLFKGEKVRSDAELKEKPVAKTSDVFNVDTTLASNFTVRSYMVGQQGMSTIYSGTSPYANRRLSFVNVGITNLYKTAYDIVSTNQIIYEVDERKVNNYQDKSQRYCVDILVSPEEKDSLYTIFQQKLNAVLPVKARITYKTIPVYVITNAGFNLALSDKKTGYGFSGRGYEGTAVTIRDFANDYLSNELTLPVVDETNLKGKFDIKTTVEMRTQEEIFKSITALGLKIEKQERKMRMLVLY